MKKKDVGVSVISSVVAASIVVLKAWFLMLLLGALAHEFGFSVLAIGFWQTILVMVALILIKD